MSVELLLARKKRREALQGREAKQYVDRFLEDETRREALSVQNLAQTAGERVAALEEVLSVRMTTLTERIDALASRLDRGGRRYARVKRV